MGSKSAEHNLEIKAIRDVVKNFQALIQMKQSEYDVFGIEYDKGDLVSGTPYENEVAFQNNSIEIYGVYGSYQWVFTRRVGNKPASLSEAFGFN